MAQMKHHPKSYGQAAAVLDGRESVKLGNNTWLEQRGDPTSILDVIAVRLHNTDIVKFWKDGQVTLHTGGYRTVTTKDRINEFITGRVYQKNHQWFYVGHDTTGALDWTHPLPFTEGMNIATEVK